MRNVCGCIWYADKYQLVVWQFLLLLLLPGIHQTFCAFFLSACRYIVCPHHRQNEPKPTRIFTRFSCCHCSGLWPKMQRYSYFPQRYVSYAWMLAINQCTCEYLTSPIACPSAHWIYWWPHCLACGSTMRSNNVVETILNCLNYK